ncbi:MAG: tetratricopeptide repeat protein [Sandaracinaceae bacterium]|nr:tetratricopeptide repeat protein [Sandaracinaceae bacterium]
MKTYRLDRVRADGWLEQLGEGSPGFAQLCEVVGTHFVAFSVIAGIRITALTVDPRSPDASVVEFEVGASGGSQKLSLGEFRQRLARAMLSADDPEAALPDEPDSEDLQQYIGFRYVLLAPLFGIRLDVLRVGSEASSLEVICDGDDIDLSLEQLRLVLRERIMALAEKHKPPSPFAIDLNVVPKARAAAAADDPAEVVELLESWPGPLSLLLRTHEGMALAPEVRATLADALGMLGSAYVALGRADWAQEVLRLAIQWAQQSLEVSAVLFRRLGEAHLAEARYGEAIGLLRRSLALGGSRTALLPLLAHCFLERQRYLPALLCADEALAAGAHEDDVREVRERSLEVLGDSWVRFRARVPA